MGKNKATQNYIQFNLTNPWENISTMRALVDNYIFSKINNDATSKSVAITVSELMENSNKFSPAHYGEFKITIDKIKKSIRIESLNYSTKDKIEQLQSTLEMIQKEDPKLAYKVLMKNSYNKGTGSNLGFARIICDFGAQIDLTLIENKEKYKDLIFGDFENCDVRPINLVHLKVKIDY